MFCSLVTTVTSKKSTWSYCSDVVEMHSRLINIFRASYTYMCRSLTFTMNELKGFGAMIIVAQSVSAAAIQKLNAVRYMMSQLPMAVTHSIPFQPMLISQL